MIPQVRSPPPGTRTFDCILPVSAELSKKKIPLFFFNLRRVPAPSPTSVCFLSSGDMGGHPRARKDCGSSLTLRSLDHTQCDLFFQLVCAMIDAVSKNIIFPFLSLHVSSSFPLKFSSFYVAQISIAACFAGPCSLLFMGYWIQQLTYYS